MDGHPTGTGIFVPIESRIRVQTGESLWCTDIINDRSCNFFSGKQVRFFSHKERDDFVLIYLLPKMKEDVSL